MAENKKTVKKKTVAKKAPIKKVSAKKNVAKKVSPKKDAGKKPVPKKSVDKSKTAVKKAPAKNKSNKDRRREDGFFWKVIKFIQRFFIIIGIATTISLIFFSLTLSQIMNYAPQSLPDKIILTYTFKEGLTETMQKPSLNQPLLRPPTTLHEVVHALDMAGDDERVQGFIARINGTGYSIAQIQELREAVTRFRDKGKFAHVFAESFGGFSTGMGAYYLSSAFDKIWLQPIGMVSITGLNSEVPFIKETLDKFGVTPQMGRRGKYKTMPESLTDASMSAPHREMLTSLLGDLSQQMLEDIAKNRDMEVEHLRALMDRAPFIDSEALNEGLVDRLDYIDVLTKEAKNNFQVEDIKLEEIQEEKSLETLEEDNKETEAPRDPELVNLMGYVFKVKTESDEKGMVGFITNYFQKKSPDSSYKDKSKIALIYGSGAIVSNKGKVHSNFMSMFGGATMAADKISIAFDSAIKDDDVRAIVFRVDSPGGSPSASETIRRMIVRAKEADKPVVVSMGGAAASGGYWISAYADKIVAQPATLTGSIGVFAGKMVLSELWGKLGIHWEGIKIGENADMWSSNAVLSKTGQERMDTMLDSIYNSFVSRVAEGRDMTFEAVDKVAQGRVWTGRQAKEVGLVDELGGLEKAIEVAKSLAEIPVDEDVPVVRFPAQKSTLELIIKMALEGAYTVPDIKVGGAGLEDALSRMALTSEEQVLRQPLLLSDF